MLPGKKHIGRPPVTGPAELAALRDLIAGGKSVTEAARILKIGRSTAYAALAAGTPGSPAQPSEWAPPPDLSEGGSLSRSLRKRMPV